MKSNCSVCLEFGDGWSFLVEIVPQGKGRVRDDGHGDDVFLLEFEAIVDYVVESYCCCDEDLGQKVTIGCGMIVVAQHLVFVADLLALSRKPATLS